MGKIIAQAVITTLLFITGLFLILSRIKHITDSSSTIYFAIGLITLLIAFVFFLVMIKSIMNYLVARSKNEQAVETVVVSSNNLLEKNNEIANSWNKTNETKDKLKLLKMSAAVDES
jgi:uncharacterized membrane protein